MHAYGTEICVDSAVTCTVAGCTVCADGYAGPDCCDCAPDFYRSTDGTCQRKQTNYYHVQNQASPHAFFHVIDSPYTYSSL